MSETSTSKMLEQTLGFSVRTAVLLLSLVSAVMIRLHAVINYGRVIHEFDPWFNFRATEYLEANGWEKFSTWYDYEVWYPLGRPVGTTIYPGLQFTSVFLYRCSEALGLDITLNDICVFVPALFSIFTCLFTYGMAYEVSRSKNAAVAASFIMAIIPAHLMRSVAGGFDNESIAVAAICATFYLWVRTLRTPKSWPLAFVVALSYTYMVAAWGAYTFVLNMIGVHAALTVMTGNFSKHLHLAYSIFYVLGTWGALQFPVVGLQPLQSMEQLGPMGVFFALQVLRVLQHFKEKHNMTQEEFARFRFSAICGVGAAASVGLALFLPAGFVGPLSARVRGLFVPHTRTGNPLVDSVAEHQATPSSVYFQYFHNVVLWGPVGFAMVIGKKLTPARLFFIAYASLSAYFSSKMIRLVLLLAPAASVSGGIALVGMLRWALGNAFGDDKSIGKTVANFLDDCEDEESGATGGASASAAATAGASPVNKRKEAKRERRAKNAKSNAYAPIVDPLREEYEKQAGLRQAGAIAVLAFLVMGIPSFWSHCQRMAPNLSEPQIMYRTYDREGKPMMIDDFREAYWWLRDNTPQDARVMAWWDYGYQINGVANRTSIADGNTWNHEHIALLGKCLISEERQAHRLIKHLADYVLVWSTRWAGMQGDDLAKHPHMARIGGSVYSDIDAGGYWMGRDGEPSELTRKSLLYKMHNYRLDPNAEDLEFFEEAYTSKYNMVRIYKVKLVSRKSREEVQAMRARGEQGYPSALSKTLSKMKAFKQH